MINLMPPAIKEEIAYARRNAKLISYLKITVLVVLILAGALVGGRYYLDQQTKAVQSQVADKQLEMAQYSQAQADATKINQRLSAIAAIQKSQARFSELLDDLAHYMPQGTAITSIGLTGDDKQPIRLTVKASDYKTALSFRDSIVRSKRISAADIQDIKADAATKSYVVTVVFAFNPGSAK